MEMQEMIDYKPRVGRPRVIDSPTQMMVLINEYFEICDCKGVPYTIAGMGVYLGFSGNEEFMRYLEYQEYYQTIKTAKYIIESQRSQALIQCKTSPVGMIFDLKNNFGWKDVTEVKHTGSLQLSSAEIDHKLAVLLQAAYKLGAIAQPMLDDDDNTQSLPALPVMASEANGIK